jgi:hypothetical protein
MDRDPHTCINQRERRGEPSQTGTDNMHMCARYRGAGGIGLG